MTTGLVGHVIKPLRTLVCDMIQLKRIASENNIVRALFRVIAIFPVFASFQLPGATGEQPPNSAAARSAAPPNQYESALASLPNDPRSVPTRCYLLLRLHREEEAMTCARTFLDGTNCSPEAATEVLYALAQDAARLPAKELLRHYMDSRTQLDEASRRYWMHHLPWRTIGQETPTP